MATKPVIFTAVADQGQILGPFLDDRTVVFNTVIININDSYDKTRGVFEAPAAGYYYFTFSYHADRNKKSGLTLMKNNNAVVKACEQPAYTDNATNTACLMLEPGDKVSVLLPAGCQVSASGRTTTFTGFLIRDI